MKLSPSECSSISDILSLKESCLTLSQFWIMVQHDGAAIIADQSPGEPARKIITIPRKTFHKMIEWYGTPQTD